MSHQIAIAKASFAATLLRPDLISVSRDEIAQFHTLLDKALTQCSPTNIQTCKRWLLKNAVSSSTRVTGLGKFLVALSASFSEHVKSAGDGSDASKPSRRRRRLHILYLVNDLLHHVKYHDASVASAPPLLSALQPFLHDLFVSAAAAGHRPEHERKIGELLDIWDDKSYYTRDAIRDLRRAINDAGNEDTSSRLRASDEARGDAALSVKRGNGRKDAFTMPASHGDPATPYYDLPAANMMPHIEPNHAAPIDPTLVQPLRFVAGPADPGLASIVTDFLKEVEQIFKPRDPEEDGEVVDVDELGGRIYRDASTGELTQQEGYYGWSKAFCDRMKRGGERRNTRQQPQPEPEPSAVALSATPCARRPITSRLAESFDAVEESTTRAATTLALTLTLILLFIRRTSFSADALWVWARNGASRRTTPSVDNVPCGRARVVASSTASISSTAASDSLEPSSGREAVPSISNAWPSLSALLPAAAAAATTSPVDHVTWRARGASV
ncbi:MAG: hypothetical protein M1838_004701 [Thelocarpon superellum]|nr:MAG: hypothetical protein M1838_004701 [Thelocarpon superellum]